MITSLILNLIYNIVNYLVGFLPTAVLPSQIADAISTINPYVSSVYVILPYVVDSLLLILFTEMTIGFAYITWKVINWIIRRFPTQS